MLNGYDVIHKAFTKQADAFSDRPQLFAPLIGVSKGTGRSGSDPLYRFKNMTVLETDARLNIELSISDFHNSRLAHKTKQNSKTNLIFLRICHFTHV